MSRGKKYPSISRNLSEAIRELTMVLGIGSLNSEAKNFVNSVRRDHDTAATLEVSQGRALVWTKERGQRKLILWLGAGGSRERGIFTEWLKMPAVAILQRRGIEVGFAPYADSTKEILFGADPDVTLPS